MNNEFRYDLNMYRKWSKDWVSYSQSINLFKKADKGEKETFI